MSSSQHFLDSKRSGKAPEKSNFVSTCNLLSQYLKEKGNLKNLSREINGQLAAIAKSETSHVTVATSKKSLNTIEDLNLPPTEETMSMDALPQFTSMASSINSEYPTNKASASKEAMEPKGAQMTIFYDGKIWVFNGLAADKAQEVALLAGKGSSQSGISNLSSTSGTDKISPPTATGASSSAAPFNPVSNSGKLKEHVQPLPDANDSVIPIARRSSLHRFLGKRKERAIAREPYQVQDAPASSSKNDEQLELKL